MLTVAYRIGPLAFAPHAIGASSGRAVIPPRSSADAVLKALRGEPGPPSAGAQTFVQATASALWVINHNLGYRPAVDVYNAGSQRVFAAVTHPTVNQTQIAVNPPQSGFVRLI